MLWQNAKYEQKLREEPLKESMMRKIFAMFNIPISISPHKVIARMIRNFFEANAIYFLSALSILY